jgi:hypothetical protein
MSLSSWYIRSGRIDNEKRMVSQSVFLLIIGRIPGEESGELVIKIRCALWLLVRTAPQRRQLTVQRPGDDWAGNFPTGSACCSWNHMSILNHPQVILRLRGDGSCT